MTDSTDLVARLRASCWSTSAAPGCKCHRCEAADAIEALQARVAQAEAALKTEHYAHTCTLTQRAGLHEDFAAERERAQKAEAALAAERKEREVGDAFYRVTVEQRDKAWADLTAEREAHERTRREQARLSDLLDVAERHLRDREGGTV